jgi:uncharacterized membrane protein YjfL (UPF0719 family)
MSKGTLVFLFGIAIVIIPTLGIPSVWKQYIFWGIGAVLILLGYMIRRSVYLQQLEQEDGVRVDDTFVETTAPLFGDSKVQ